MQSFFPSLLIPLLLNGCSHIEPNSVPEYLTLAPAEPDVKQNPRIQPLIKLYNQFKDASLSDRITEIYAEKLYFNDTIVTLHERRDLANYLKKTQQQLDSTTFEVLSIHDQGQDSLIRWVMQSRDIQSIGISHLRFNSDGKIILHQDYWDSMQGFYQHLPLIGGILQWIKNGLHD